MTVGSFVVVAVATGVGWMAARARGAGMIVMLTGHACLYGVAVTMVWWSAAPWADPQIVEVAARLSFMSVLVWSLAIGLLRRLHPRAVKLVLVGAAMVTGGLFYSHAIHAVWASEGVCLPPARLRAEIPEVVGSTCELGK